MYRIHRINILCDDEVVSPVTPHLHSVVQVCTVGSWGLLFSRDSNPREVAQLNATVGFLCEHSSLQLLKHVGKFTDRTLSRDKAEI